MSKDIENKFNELVDKKLSDISWESVEAETIKNFGILVGNFNKKHIDALLKQTVSEIIFQELILLIGSLFVSQFVAYVCLEKVYPIFLFYSCIASFIFFLKYWKSICESYVANEELTNIFKLISLDIESIAKKYTKN
jgi:hypothetical protein